MFAGKKNTGQVGIDNMLPAFNWHLMDQPTYYQCRRLQICRKVHRTLVDKREVATCASSAASQAKPTAPPAPCSRAASAACYFRHSCPEWPRGLRASRKAARSRDPPPPPVITISRLSEDATDVPKRAWAGQRYSRFPLSFPVATIPARTVQRLVGAKEFRVHLIHRLEVSDIVQELGASSRRRPPRRIVCAWRSTSLV